MEQRQSAARQVALYMASLVIAASVPAVVRRLSRSLSPASRVVVGAAMGAGVALLWFPRSKLVNHEREVHIHENRS